MKKIFTLLCAGMICAGMANAKVMFQESFDGLNGNVGQLCAGSTNSVEFFDEVSYDSLRWWSYSGSSNYIQVVEGSLSYEGYQTGIGNKAYLYSSGADDVRSFAHKPVTSGKIYMGAIINVEELSTVTTGDYFMCLGDHANSKFLGRVYTKTIKENDTPVGFKLGIAKNNESANYLHYSEEVFAPNTDILVVVEYEFLPGDSNDVVCLYINPTKETLEPTVKMCPDTTTSGNVKQGANAKPDAGQYGIFGAFLRQGYDSSAKTRSTPKMFVDEIKVVTKWDELWVEGEGEQPIDDGSVENIAELMASPIQKTYLLKSQPVVTRIEGSGSDLCVTVQDESGAVIINDFFETDFLENAQVGDKINHLAAMPIESNRYINGLPTAQLKASKDEIEPNVVSTGNSVEPFEVSLAQVTAFGPALVQLRGVEFASEEELFKAGEFNIREGEASAVLRVPSGCDIIGEAVPSTADVKGLVVKGGASAEVLICESADVTNRVKKEAQGVETVESQQPKAKSQKLIKNGQMVILRGDKMFNILGAEL